MTSIGKKEMQYILSSFGALLFFLPLLFIGAAGNMWLTLLTVSFFIILVGMLIWRIRAAIIGWLFVLLVALQAQWGIAQFVVQHNLNLWYLGEARISPAVDGVAKFAIGEEKFVRAYGPYRHANVLGGVLLMGILCLGLLRRRVGGTLDERIFLGLALVLLLGIVVTFSRTALIGLLLLGWLLWFDDRLLVRKFGYFGLIILLALSPMMVWRMIDRNDVAVTDRILGYGWALDIFEGQSVWQGDGKPYLETLGHYLSAREILFEPWQVDFVHSGLLLILVQLGLMPFVTLLALLIWLLARFGYWQYWRWFLVLLPPIMFDHYFFTQASPLLMLIIYLSLIPRLGS